MAAVVAIDIDGVLYEWQEEYVRILREVRGVGDVDIKDWTSWSMPGTFGSASDREWMSKNAQSYGLFTNGRMVKNACQGLKALAQFGCVFHIATSRPPEVQQLTYDWVTQNLHDLPIIAITFTEGSKSSVNADVLIDDSVEFVIEWADTTNKPAVLFKRLWNVMSWTPELAAKYPGVVLADGWLEVVSCLVGEGGILHESKA